MISAVDTSVLLDVFAADPVYLESSRNALRKCLAEGSLIACEVVWAETVAFFPSQNAGLDAMTRLGIEFSTITVEVALHASEFWKAYRKRGGTRLRILPDFLIGAHALMSADRLLTRDSRFYGRYFSGLAVMNPVKNSHSS